MPDPYTGRGMFEVGPVLTVRPVILLLWAVSSNSSRTQAFCDSDKVGKNKDHFIILPNHRRKQVHCANHWNTQHPLSPANECCFSNRCSFRHIHSSLLLRKTFKDNHLLPGNIQSRAKPCFLNTSPKSPNTDQILKQVILNTLLRPMLPHGTCSPSLQGAKNSTSLNYRNILGLRLEGIDTLLRCSTFHFPIKFPPIPSQLIHPLSQMDIGVVWLLWVKLLWMFHRSLLWHGFIFPRCTSFLLLL